MLALAAALLFGGAACKKDDGAAKPAEETAKTEGADAEAAKAEPMKKVEVTAEGTKFDPAVEKAAIPEGAWYCDMGTVHYARSEKGDGKCPLCKMDLKHMAAHE
jgi:rubrerythrin